ncbi:hypothetical protein OAI47_01100 [Rhodospirillaceae bacterium]|nr:hypothetical protein [Rhodospirillaceae bacterium]
MKKKHIKQTGAKLMVAISAIIAKPDTGKEDEAKKRMKHRATIMSNNGFKTRVAEGISGPSAGLLAVQGTTENWTQMGEALTKLSSDPEFIEWQTNRRKNPVGHMVRRAGMRTVFGEPKWSEFPVSYYRRYTMPRSNMKKALDIIGEIDAMTTDEWAISAAVPITGADMNSFLAAYQFKSFVIMGKCLDEIGMSEKMQDIVSRASELGTLQTADVMITV